MVEEIKSAISDEMPEAEDWTRVNVRSMINRVVAKVSSRAFIGPDLCRDEEWIRISIDFTQVAVGAMFAIKKWHPLLRPFVYRFIPECQRAAKYMTDAKKIVGPMLKSRLRAETDGSKWYQKPDDIFQWFMDKASKAQRTDVGYMTKEMVTMNFAALNTAANNITQNLYELAARPEYIKPLREELEKVLGENDGLFTKHSVEQLHKLDSFLKEAHTYNPTHYSMYNSPRA